MSDSEVLPNGSLIIVDFVQKETSTLERLQQSTIQRILTKKNESIIKTRRSSMADFPAFRIAVDTLIALNFAQASSIDSDAQVVPYYQEGLKSMRRNFSQEQWHDAQALSEKTVREIVELKRTDRPA